VTSNQVPYSEHSNIRLRHKKNCRPNDLARGNCVPLFCRVTPQNNISESHTATRTPNLARYL